MTKQEKEEKEEDRSTGETETAGTRGSLETRTGLTREATTTAPSSSPTPTRDSISNSYSCHKELAIREGIPLH
jgi:hypothetical protein